MADRSTGPVQPPVIDLTARNANAKPEERSAADSAPPRRAGRTGFGDTSWPLLGGAAVGGAVLGTILTYLLANALPLPSRVTTPDLQPEVTAQGERLEALSSGLTELQQSAARTQISLDATIAQLDSGLAAVNQSIADVEASIPTAQPPVDLAPLQDELRTLKAQIDAIGAGASGADASAIAQSIASLETGITSLTTRLNGVDSTVTALRTDLEAARQTLTAHIDSALPNEVGPALKLPLILSGLESAFITGKPFQQELDSLRSVLPSFAVPETLSTAAATGLERPDALLRRFADVVPDVLAARETSNADWTQNAVDWAKGLLALRPIEEMEGDSPEALVSRLEAAMARRDYSTASTLLNQLPQKMRDAAALVAADIRVHAEADTLVAELRARALTETAAP
ncbi:MAG: hypothetical protein EOP22_02260 [Hyphomicrobiales bacterium]|nr:MAG: hypothetical protein EOP22_02260 [Hyphomicrobiales bacterium]